MPGRTLQRVSKSAGRDAILAAVKADGGVIIEGFLTPEQVAQVNADIDPALSKLHAGSKHNDEGIQEFHGSNTKRLTNLTSLSKTFGQDILDMDIVHELCEKIFKEESGDYWMSTAQVIEIGPGNKTQPLHRDQMGYPIFTRMGRNGPEAMVNFLTALTEFTEENGATRVIPGSHLWEDFEDYGRPEDTIPALMKAGDALFINGKVSHGGGANKTSDFYRRGIAFNFQCSFLTPEEAYPFITSMETVRQLSPRAQKMIGFRSQFPKDSLGLWQSDYSELADFLKLDSLPTGN